MEIWEVPFLFFFLANIISSLFILIFFVSEVLKVFYSGVVCYLYATKTGVTIKKIRD
jgi:hypothetical protein